MAWLAVDKDKDEFIFDEKPIRQTYSWRYLDNCVILPKGSIKKLIGRNLTWKDEPVELK